MILQPTQSFSFHGVALLDARGAGNLKPLAKAFKSLCYEVSVLADGDAEKLFSPVDEAELVAYGVSVHMWSDKLSLEERAFQDLPWASVLSSVKLAQELGYPVYDQVLSMLLEELDMDVGQWIESLKLRIAIGDAAKKCKWFKDTTRGDLWFKAISPAFLDPAFVKRNLALELAQLWEWAEHV